MAEGAKSDGEPVADGTSAPADAGQADQGDQAAPPAEAQTTDAETNGGE